MTTVTPDMAIFTNPLQALVEQIAEAQGMSPEQTQNYLTILIQSILEYSEQGGELYLPSHDGQMVPLSGVSLVFNQLTGGGSQGQYI